MEVEKQAVAIRQLSRDDISAVIAIENETNPSPWTFSQFEAELDNPSSRFDLLTVGSQVVAFLCAWIVVDEMQIQDVATAPAFQRRGYAAKLLNHALARAGQEGVLKVFLEVRPGNHSARELYRKFGFVDAGIRPRYYSNNEDALLMELEIEQPPAQDDSIENEDS